MSKTSRLFSFLKNSLKKKDFPDVINYEITSRCNLNCEHCYWRKTIKSKKELSCDEWKHVFLEHKSRGANSAYLTGGEPALRLDIIKLADDIFDGLGIVSNGVIKIPDEIQRRIFISIDGPKEIHDKIRGRKVFDIVLKNIKDDKRVILTPTLSTTNYMYIGELVKIAKDANVEGITFSTYTSHNKENDPLLLKGKELDETVDKLKEVWKKNKDIVFLTPSMINLFKTKEHYKQCYFKGKNFISFDAALNIKRPCVIGEGVDCSTCGCIVPVMSHSLKHLDIKSWILFDRYFPERY